MIYADNLEAASSAPEGTIAAERKTFWFCEKLDLDIAENKSWWWSTAPEIDLVGFDTCLPKKASRRDLGCDMA